MNPSQPDLLGFSCSTFSEREPLEISDTVFADRLPLLSSKQQRHSMPTVVNSNHWSQPGQKSQTHACAAWQLMAVAVDFCRLPAIIIGFLERVHHLSSGARPHRLLPSSLLAASSSLSRARDCMLERWKFSTEVVITFYVRRRRREMYGGHGRLCLCVCLSLPAFSHYWTDPDVTWGMV